VQAQASALFWLGIGISATAALTTLLGVGGQNPKAWLIVGDAALMVISYLLAAFYWWVNRPGRRTPGNHPDDPTSRSRENLDAGNEV
jgi:hypothetical protein